MLQLFNIRPQKRAEFEPSTLFDDASAKDRGVDDVPDDDQPVGLHDRALARPLGPQRRWRQAGHVHPVQAAALVDHFARVGHVCDRRVEMCADANAVADAKTEPPVAAHRRAPNPLGRARSSFRHEFFFLGPRRDEKASHYWKIPAQALADYDQDDWNIYGQAAQPQTRRTRGRARTSLTRKGGGDKHVGDELNTRPASRSN